MELYKIGDDRAYAFVSSKGGTVHEFVRYGDDIVAPYKIINGIARGGIQICSPFFGPPGESMPSLPRHGWLRDQELEVVSINKSFIMLGGENEPCEDYPWKLSYNVVVTVSDDGSLKVALIVTRLDDGEFFIAPINPGFHPYFCSNPKDLIARCLARIGSDVIADFPSKSQMIPQNGLILVRSGKNTVRVNLTEGFNSFSQLILWSDNADEYFCLEPVLTHPNEFGTPKGQFLDCAGSKIFSFKLEVL